MRRWTRARSLFGQQDAMSLVEVIVAVTILAIVMGGLTATMINALNLSRSNANRVVAANLAAGEIQRIQSLDFAEVELLATAAEVSSPEVDGIRFTMTSNARWVSNDGVVGSCTTVADAGAENILRVDVEVSWEPQRFSRPVTTQTSIAPPFEAYGADGGSLAVFVSDTSIPPNPLPGATVDVIDVATQIIVHGGLQVDDAGCLVVSGLPQGDYDVEVSLAGYVDAQTGDDPATQRAGVRTGFRTNVEFFLASAGQLGSTVIARDGTDGLAGALPTGLARTAIGPTELGEAVWALPSDGGTSSVPTGSYELWAGSCLDGDPGPGLRSEQEVLPVPPVTALIEIATVDVEWAPGLAPGGGGPALTLFAEHVGECDELAPGVDPEIEHRRFDLGQMPRAQDGTRQIALPWGGPWRITAEQTQGQGQVVARAVTGDVTLDASDPAVALVQLGVSTCTVQAPTWVTSGSQLLSSPIGPGSVTVSASGSLLDGDLVVVDVASEASDAAEWRPVDPGWSRIPGGAAGDQASTVSWVRTVVGNATGVSVTLDRPGVDDTARRRGAVHVNVYRGAESVASSHPVGGVGQLQSNRINLPGVQLRPGALLHTTVLLEGSNPAGPTLNGGTLGGGPSSFDGQPSDADLDVPNLLFVTYRTLGTSNTNNQRLDWTGTADAREIRRLRFMGACQ